MTISMLCVKPGRRQTNDDFQSVGCATLVRVPPVWYHLFNRLLACHPIPAVFDVNSILAAIAESVLRRHWRVSPLDERLLGIDAHRS